MLAGPRAGVNPEGARNCDKGRVLEESFRVLKLGALSPAEFTQLGAALINLLRLRG
jgi:hypothetical protein